MNQTLLDAPRNILTPLGILMAFDTCFKLWRDVLDPPHPRTYEVALVHVKFFTALARDSSGAESQPWSVAEWAVALRFDNPRATVLVLVLG